jgi:hypothetical protein
MCLTLVPFAVCSLPTYNIHANLQQLSARVRVATAVNRFHTLRGAGCGRGGLRYGSEDYWLVHGVSIQGIEKMVGLGGAVDAHAGGLMEADHLPHGWELRPREGCALPEGATMGVARAASLAIWSEPRKINYVDAEHAPEGRLVTPNT